MAAIQDNRTTLRYREVGGPGRIVQDRGASHTCRLGRVAGCGIIGAQRTNSAHLHRPWRANVPHHRSKNRKAGRAHDSGQRAIGIESFLLWVNYSLPLADAAKRVNLT